MPASGLWLAIVGSGVWVGLGCQTLIGIEDRSFPATGGEGNAGTGGAVGGSGAGTSAQGGMGAEAGEGGANAGGGGGPPVSEACASFCSAVMANCTGDLQMYASIEACHTVCALLEPGDPLEPQGNTVACRAAQAEVAGNSPEPEVHCPRTSPGGGDLCGSDCEGYCYLLERACQVTIEDCPAKCAAFSAPGEFNATIYAGDTLWCRLNHVSAAAADPEIHCQHSIVVPTSACVDDPASAPTCEDYCRAANIACVDDLTVYESEAQCLATCEALDPGTVADRNVNTVGCRKYHAFAAITGGAADHCPHASPTGANTCGRDETGVCASYCRLAEAACPGQFDVEFDNTDECLAACAALPPTEGYTVAAMQSGNTAGCRVLHAARALTTSGGCNAVFGGSPCSD